MKFEQYKFCIELVNSPREMENEPDMDMKLNKLLSDWSQSMRRKHPDFNYRICNGETSVAMETSIMQPMPASIRFVIHVAYTT